MSSQCIKEGGSRWVCQPMMLWDTSLPAATLLSLFSLALWHFSKVSNNPNEKASASSLIPSIQDQILKALWCHALLCFYSLEIWNLTVSFKRCDFSSLLQLDPFSGVSLWYVQQWSRTVVPVPPFLLFSCITLCGFRALRSKNKNLRLETIITLLWNCSQPPGEGLWVNLRVTCDWQD